MAIDYGYTGHREACGSGKGMENYAMQLLRSDYKDIDSSLRERRVTAERVFRMARNGDVVAKQILSRVIEINAAMLGNVINSYSPELITLGGSVILNNGDLMLSGMRESSKKYAINRMPEIRITPLGADSCILGAAASILHPEWVKDYWSAG